MMSRLLCAVRHSWSSPNNNTVYHNIWICQSHEVMFSCQELRPYLEPSAHHVPYIFTVQVVYANALYLLKKYACVQQPVSCQMLYWGERNHRKDSFSQTVAAIVRLDSCIFLIMMMGGEGDAGSKVVRGKVELARPAVPTTVLQLLHHHLAPFGWPQLSPARPAGCVNEHFSSFF
jgi:hypothetical protein